VISELLQAEFEGHRLGDEDVLSHVRLLFPTGAETTAGAIGSLLFALLSEPGAWQRMRLHPEDRPSAIEELLRWENPVAITPRVSASEPVELAGVPIPADSPVLFCIAAAHRDPQVFPEPDRFDLDRRPENLLSFGPGPRQCPGMHLARKELRVALDVLCERFPDLRMLDAQASQPVGTVLRSPAELRVSTRR
jgi:cytochrome P450